MLRNLVDGFSNVIAGLGANNPKQAGAGYVVDTNSALAEIAYRTSTWFGKIVEVPADDATREWRAWMGEADQVTALENEERRLGIVGKVRQALIWQRLYGGAAIYLGLPGDPSTPVPTGLGKGSLQFVNVVAKDDLSIGEIDDNLLSPTYGQPKFYTVGAATFHPSRVVRFNGRAVGRRSSVSADGWGDSMWTHLADSITTADGAAAVLGALLIEAKTDIVKIPDLIANMGSSEFSSLFLRRIQSAQTLKSVTGVMLMDKSEEHEQKQIDFAGIPATVETALMIMCGAADIPMVRMLGTSAKGLNATGVGDLKNHYDNVRAQQTLKISPALELLDDALIRSALGNRPTELWYSWTPLFQPTEKEQAETAKLLADADSAYVSILDNRALAESIVSRLEGSGLYPGISEAVARSAELSIETEAELDPELVGDAAPRTLYVCRKLRNVKDLAAWAKSQGIKLQPDLHVTIIYSRAPVDWIKAGEDYHEDAGGNLTIKAGGPRIIDTLGNRKVLLFSANRLVWRHLDIMDRTGASWDFEDFQPHVSLCLASEGPDVMDIAPYTGVLEFGPEEFSEIRS